MARCSVGKLQFPLNSLEARLFAQGIEEGISLHVKQTRITDSHGLIEPLQRLAHIAPLPIDPGVLVRRSIAICCLHSRNHSVRIRVSSKLVVRDRQTPQGGPVILFGLALRARAGEITGSVVSEPAIPDSELVAGVKTDHFCESGN